MPGDEDVPPDRGDVAADRAAGLLQLERRDRLGQPPVVRLASDLQCPARHHHGNPGGGQLAHERVEAFPETFAWSTCFAGFPVDYRTYEGRNHVPLVEPDSPAIADLLTWT